MYELSTRLTSHFSFLFLLLTYTFCTPHTPTRCPDCSVEDMAARNAFINSLAATLKSAAPNQLTFSGTEGFFAPGQRHGVTRWGVVAAVICCCCSCLTTQSAKKHRQLVQSL